MIGRGADVASRWDPNMTSFPRPGLTASDHRADVPCSRRCGSEYGQWDADLRMARKDLGLPGGGQTGEVDGQSSGRRRHSPRVASGMGGFSGDVNCGVRVSLLTPPVWSLASPRPPAATPFAMGRKPIPLSSTYFDPEQALRTNFDPSPFSPSNPYALRLSETAERKGQTQVIDVSILADCTPASFLGYEDYF